MKNAIAIIVALAALVAAEVPPQRGYLAPQTTYGPPQKQFAIEPIRAQLAAKIISSKLTIEQLIRLTEQLSSQQSAQQATDNSYLPPRRAPQTTYGTPNRPQVPQNTYGAPPSNQPPSTTYGVPADGTTSLEHFDRLRVQHTPPRNFGGQQQNAYNTIEPILRDMENAKLQNALSKQFLPVKEPIDFKGQNSYGISTQNNAPKRYVPPRGGHSPDPVDIRPGTVRQLGVDNNPNNFDVRRLPSGTNNVATESPVNEQGVDQKYLPPTTTRRTVNRRPSRPVGTTTPVPESTDVPELGTDPEESTESPTKTDGSPNVAVATAVSGGDVFYLHPDGRLQRVILQNTQQQQQQDIDNNNFKLYSQDLQYQQPFQAFSNAFYTPFYTLSYANK